ncbi:hypothetical protein Y032_0102g3430 [Ancylostoma ceylanicum]|uniref:Uncharacterized protein n=1 Tax=Ancylostoma ceylanicum TaxID=53326 RepID=A0A016TH81_9BILA|nr:hypothetical protein Y032_0102g3430 [Ancylostoma ceylanicum]
MVYRWYINVFRGEFQGSRLNASSEQYLLTAQIFTFCEKLVPERTEPLTVLPKVGGELNEHSSVHRRSRLERIEFCSFLAVARTMDG